MMRNRKCRHISTAGALRIYRSMHGLSPDDLIHIEQLCGQSVVQVGVGEYQLHFATHPVSHLGISVEGRCELLDETNHVVDVWNRGQRSTEFRFFDLLGGTIEGVTIDSEKSFIAKFNTGVSLRVVDDSEQCESFSVGGLYV